MGLFQYLADMLALDVLQGEHGRCGRARFPATAQGVVEVQRRALGQDEHALDDVF